MRFHHGSEELFKCTAPFFKKTVADSNAPVQEKALDALITFLKAADVDAGRKQQSRPQDQTK